MASTDHHISDVPVQTELRGSFLSYAMSVIVSRALPDVRDGLKPVHRRILYAMAKMNLRPDRAYVKSARVVGETMGKYHPHGDTAIYDALVRLAQDWAMRVTLVDGHGNFGTHDDGPAASRYTEARMAPAALPMTDELDEDTVDFAPNYDGSANEPSVLPAAFPNLLVNGTEGIAVGMATRMAPHNMREVVAACRHLLTHPGATLDELMEFIPGPDMPTGATIMDLEGIRRAYETGRGRFTMRAKTHFEDVSARRKGIVITQLPYQVGVEQVIAAVKRERDKDRLAGVSNVVDLTDRKSGLRLVVECKVGHNPEKVLDELLAYTPLQTNFHIHNLALVNGQPRTLSLTALLTHYVDHRREVTRRRCEYRKRKAEDRAHLLRGYLIALANINEVVKVIRNSKDTTAARKQLCKNFELDTTQATAILEMPLRRLTGLEVSKIEEELKDLETTIAELIRLLTSPAAMNALISDELEAVAATHGTDRRSAISKATTTVEIPTVTEVADAPAQVIVTLDNKIGYITAKTPTAKTSPKAVKLSHRTTTAATIALVTSTGSAHYLPVTQLPELTPKTPGGEITDYVELAENETLTGLLPIGELPHPAVFATRHGTVKLLNPADMPKRTGNKIITVKDGDTLIHAGLLPGSVEEVDLLFVTDTTQLLRTPATNVRPQGRTGRGVAGVRLAEEATVVAFAAVPHTNVDTTLVTTIAGVEQVTVKSTPVTQYPAKGRGGAGVRCMNLRAKQTHLTHASISVEPVAVNTKGTPVALPAVDPRRASSGQMPKKPIATLAEPWPGFNSA